MTEGSDSAGAWMSSRLQRLWVEQPPVLALADHEEEVVGADGSVRLDRLAALVARGDVDAGVCSDEELHWLRPDADAPAEVSLDAPALGLLDAGEQDAALATALRLLLARGECEVGEHGRLRWRGRAAVLARLRHAAEAVWSVRVDRRESGTERAAIYRADGEVFVLEAIDPAGLHAFWVLSCERQARCLAEALDPEGWAALARSHTGVGLGGNLGRTAAHAARLIESQARIARLHGDLLGALTGWASRAAAATPTASPSIGSWPAASWPAPAPTAPALPAICGATAPSLTRLAGWPAAASPNGHAPARASSAGPASACRQSTRFMGVCRATPSARRSVERRRPAAR